MNFHKLEKETKEKLHKDLLSNAMSIGGKNTFLQLIEDIRAIEEEPLLIKIRVLSYAKGKIKWNKSIYKDNHILLLEAIKKEEKDGNILVGLTPKKQKSIINMLKTLNPLTFTVKPKNQNDGVGFTFKVIDFRDKENSKIDMMFKIIFFYNIDFAKQVLKYEIKD